MINNNKGLAITVEYVFLITVVVGALLTMQVYLKRSFQGRLRESADEVGQLYDPDKTAGTTTITTTIDNKITVRGRVPVEGGWVSIRREDIDETFTTDIDETVAK